MPKKIMNCSRCGASFVAESERQELMETCNECMKSISMNYPTKDFKENKKDGGELFK